MVGYHGTPSFIAKKILKDGFIELTNRENQTYSDTTLGYVHLTVDVPIAVDFALRAAGQAINNEKVRNADIVIFKVCMSEGTQMFPDEDELSGTVFYELKDNIDTTGTFRVNKRLFLGEEVTDYFGLRLSTIGIGYDLLDSGRFQDISLLNWKKL